MPSELINDLNSTDVKLRRIAAEGLSRHDQASAAAVSLVRACSDPDEEVREWATAALEEIAAASVEDVTAIAELLDAPGHDSAYWAATLLGRMGGEAAEAVPNLARLVASDRETAIRQRSAWALGKIGRPAAPAADALRDAASADDPRLARLAQQALQAVLAK